MNELFQAISVSSIPLSKGHVVTVPSDSSLLDAAQILFVNKVHAAPVVDVSKPDETAWNEKYMGIVDLIGIVCAIIEKSPEAHHRPKTFEEYLAKHHPHMVKTVKDAMGTWRWGPFIPLEDKATMLDAMLLLSKYQVHRLPVVTSGGDIVNMITQSNVVAMLAGMKEELAPVSKKTLTELGLGSPQKVFTVPIASKTIEAFRIIAKEKVSAVGVLGANDMLIGTVSATDIRLMIQHPELFSLLNEELRVFYESSRLTQPNIMNPAVRCSPHDTLERVLDLLNGTHIHRVFVVDPAGRPVRVLSLCDVIAPFVTEPEGYFGNYFVHGIPAGQVGL